MSKGVGFLLPLRVAVLVISGFLRNASVNARQTARAMPSPLAELATKCVFANMRRLIDGIVPCGRPNIEPTEVHQIAGAL